MLIFKIIYLYIKSRFDVIACRALAETAHNGFICVAAVKNHINTEGIVVTTELVYLLIYCIPV